MRLLKGYLIVAAIYYLIAAWAGPWIALGLIAAHGLLQILAQMWYQRQVQLAILHYIDTHPEIIAPRTPEAQSEKPSEDSQNEI